MAMNDEENCDYLPTIEEEEEEEECQQAVQAIMADLEEQPVPVENVIVDVGPVQDDPTPDNAPLIQQDSSNRRGELEYLRKMLYLSFFLFFLFTFASTGLYTRAISSSHNSVNAPWPSCWGQTPDEQQANVFQCVFIVVFASLAAVSAIVFLVSIAFIAYYVCRRPASGGGGSLHGVFIH